MKCLLDKDRKGQLFSDDSLSPIVETLDSIGFTAPSMMPLRFLTKSEMEAKI